MRCHLKAMLSSKWLQRLVAWFNFTPRYALQATSLWAMATLGYVPGTPLLEAAAGALGRNLSLLPGMDLQIEEQCKCSHCWLLPLVRAVARKKCVQQKSSTARFPVDQLLPLLLLLLLLLLPPLLLLLLL
jgi:hypothetical protein